MPVLFSILPFVLLPATHVLSFKRVTDAVSLCPEHHLEADQTEAAGDRNMCIVSIQTFPLLAP